MHVFPTSAAATAQIEDGEREREVGWRSKNIKFPCRRTEKFKRLNRMSIK